MEKIKFISEGLGIVGNLFKPVNFNPEKKYTAIIVDGSWTTVKEQMQGNYAKELAKKGFVCLAFDHRNFGESEGQPREYENYELKIEDIKNAITYLESLPYVSRDGIGGLGICASAAYMLQAAAEDNRMKFVATIAAWLMTPETAKLFYGGEEGINGRIEKAVVAKKQFVENGKVENVPAYDPNNMEAAMFFPVDYYANRQRGAIATWRNNFAVMSWEKWLTYDGIASTKNLKTPLVMIASEKQFLPNGTQAAFDNISESPKRIAWLNHFEHTDFYDSPEAIEASVQIISEAVASYYLIEEEVTLR